MRDLVNKKTERYSTHLNICGMFNSHTLVELFFLIRTLLHVFMKSFYAPTHVEELYEINIFRSIFFALNDFD